MEKHLKAPVKEVISAFPQVGRILTDSGVGCVSCAAGTCSLGDVVSIHNLTPDQETELMYRIEKAIYPQRNVKMPLAKTASVPKAPGQYNYSPPLKRLVDEHARIKQVLAELPRLCPELDLACPAHCALLAGVVDFIRVYADKFHHVKEEDILFSYADKNQEIIRAMLRDHAAAREHVRRVVLAAEAGDKNAAAAHLLAYRELLLEHIKKEDEILYPWLDRNLSMSQVGELFSAFNEAQNEIDQAAVARCEKFSAEIAEKLQNLLQEV